MLSVASGIPIVAALKFSDMLRYYGESNIISVRDMSKIDRYLER